MIDDRDDDKVAACPECDVAALRAHTDGYYCRNCYSVVEEINHRPPKETGSQSRYGLARDLVEADPSEVSR